MTLKDTRSAPQTTAWTDTLDVLAAQVDRQELAITTGAVAPPPLDIEVLDVALVGDERLRALELFERTEKLALLAAAAIGRQRRRFSGGYRNPTDDGQTTNR